MIGKYHHIYIYISPFWLAQSLKFAANITYIPLKFMDTRLPGPKKKGHEFHLAPALVAPGVWLEAHHIGHFHAPGDLPRDGYVIGAQGGRHFAWQG